MTLYEEIASLSPYWQDLLLDASLQPTLRNISLRLEAFRTQGHTVYPPEGNLFNALRYCADPSQVRVVILGQDPYARPGQATGLSFSVSSETTLPPSLRNIFLEIQREFGGALRTNGDLRDWAVQGVLLLNTILSAHASSEGGGGMSHASLGWQTVTDAIITRVNQQSPACVFLLWGRAAQEKRSLIDRSKHLTLESAHPSPLSARRGFIGCNHFLQANSFLHSHGIAPIRWC